MKTFLAKTSYGTIEYSIYGIGEPILFIHGGHSNARETLTHKHIDPDKFTLITPSRPGYGQTPLGQNESPTKAAAQIIELMDLLSFSTFNVIGISAGGLIAIALVSSNQDRVLKFVMTSCISKRWLSPKDPLYRKGRLMFHHRVESMTWGMLRFGVKYFPVAIMKKMLNELTLKPDPKLTQEAIDDLSSMLLNQRSGKGFLSDLEHDLEAFMLAQIETPTLIVHSKNDCAVSIEHAEYAHQQIQNSKIVRLNNEFGHLIWIGEESQKNIAPIIAFLIE